jgi:hypothetical protein
VAGGAGGSGHMAIQGTCGRATAMCRGQMLAFVP